MTSHTAGGSSTTTGNLGDRADSTAPASGTSPGDSLRVPVLFFDGVCGLCNHVVDFVLRHDSSGRLDLAPLQGATAREVLNSDDTESLRTIVLVTEKGTYRYSSAVVRILLQLGLGWKILGCMLWLIPLPLRDLGYTLVARNRYRFFGKKEVCRIPTPEERDRFLP